jgi:hypothetical protein
MRAKDLIKQILDQGTKDGLVFDDISDYFDRDGFVRVQARQVADNLEKSSDCLHGRLYSPDPDLSSGTHGFPEFSGLFSQ